MINITDKHNCCGCEACVQCCPKQCISMHEDYEGFLYPEVDMQSCIDCGLCEKVCPEINILPEKQPAKVLGAKLKDKDIVYKSSSGGIFTYLANKILDDGGVVFGARFNDEWEVVHDYTETKDGLSPFRKSKYVQSRIGKNFKIAQSFLKEGRKVLFTGTPCQIKALKLFLRKEYENLLAVDIACHSVPSPKVWRLYLNQLLKDNNLKHKDIMFIDFRDKRNGWDKYNFTVKHSFGEISIPGRTNIYMKAFLSNLSTRPSCESCNSKCGQSNSDLTIADFWGVNETNPDFYKDSGVSLVLVNSEKGKTLMNSKDLEIIETTLNDVVKYNGGINKEHVVNNNRKMYFNRLDIADDFILFTTKYTKNFNTPSFYSKVKFNLIKIYKNIIK